MKTLLLNSKPLIDGSGNSLSDGGLVSILAVILVFLILAIIIIITYFASKVIDKYLTTQKNKTSKLPKNNESSVSKIDVDLNDEDAVVALLVASIDYRNEIKKDFKVKSIKEIK